MKHIPPGLALLLLGPIVGELASGHTAPLEFLNPLAFVVLALPYGFGAVLVREALVRWKKGWPSFILLALAYGVYEEGIVVRSIFNGDWQELGAAPAYGYWGGVHFTYGLMLLHFHVVVSIGVSILLAHVLYPARRHERWVGPKSLVACFVGLLLWLPAGWLMTQYRPPWTHDAGAWLVLAGLVAAARLAPPALFAQPGFQSPRARWFFALGFLNVTILFISIGHAGDTGTPPFPLLFALLVLLDGVCLGLLVRWSGGGAAWRDAHRLAWVAGTMSFFIIFGGLQDAEQWRGRSLVSVATVVALALLWKRVLRREANVPTGAPSVGGAA